MENTLSIIIPCLNEGELVEKMVSNIVKTIETKSYEIIIINSGGTETSRVSKLTMVSIYDTAREGAAQARNFGANKASGDVLIFADAHLEFKPSWDTQIFQALEIREKSIVTPCITVFGDENSRACGFKWKNLRMEVEWLPDMKSGIHEIPFACGCCMAARKKIFNEIGKFDSGNRFWGVEDAEICLRAWLLGYSVLCEPSIRVGHMFRTKHPYELEWIDVLYNEIRLAFSHFKPERLTKYLRAIYQIPNFDIAYSRVLESDVLNRRIKLFNERVYDDDWFFQKFPMNEYSLV
jgi:glycosyltransferase involved in cell wall biosynthesis